MLQPVHEARAIRYSSSLGSEVVDLDFLRTAIALGRQIDSTYLLAVYERAIEDAKDGYEELEDELKAEREDLKEIEDDRDNKLDCINASLDILRGLVNEWDDLSEVDRQLTVEETIDKVRSAIEKLEKEEE